MRASWGALQDHRAVPEALAIAELFRFQKGNQAVSDGQLPVPHQSLNLTIGLVREVEGNRRIDDVALAQAAFTQLDALFENGAALGPDGHGD